MALLGINNVAQYQGRTGTLDRIAKGVDIATKILGTGAGLYNQVAYQQPLASAQTQSLKADTQFKQATSNIEMAKLGFMPVDPDHVHLPDVSSGPGAVQMSQGGTTVQTNEHSPSVMKVGNQHYVQVANPMIWTDQTKAFIEGQAKQGKVITSDSDPDPTRLPTVVPGLPYPINFKQAALDPEKAATINDKLDQAFLKDQNVQRFNNVDSAANAALAVGTKSQSGQPITRPDDMALLMASIKAMNPDSNLRFSNENIEGFKGEITPQVSALIEQWHHLWTDKEATLPDPIRNGIVSTVSKLYQSERANYDGSYQSYLKQMQNVGLQPTAHYLPPIQFPGMQASLGNQVAAKSPGMAQERMKTQNPSFNTQFPAPTQKPASNFDSALKFFGGQ